MRALVISGGGSKGAYGGGISEYLIKDLGHEYDILLGASTGSLLIPFIAIEELDKLKDAYTSVTQDSIFKVNPFKIKKGKVSINHWNVLYNILIRGKKTFGDSSNLRKLINHFLTENDYNLIIKSKKKVEISITNITKSKAEFKSIEDNSYEDFCDWMWASTCFPPFMSLVNKDGCEYVDSGVIEHVPIQRAIDLGASEIDVIVLSTKERELPIQITRNAFHLIVRVADIMMNEIGKNDINIAKLNAEDKSVKLNFYYTDRTLTENPLIFDKEQMTKWWQEGYEYAKNNKQSSYILEGTTLKSINNV